MEHDLLEQLMEKCKQFEWYSLTLDDMTDVTDTAQLLICTRGVNNDFDIIPGTTFDGVNERQCNWRGFAYESERGHKEAWNSMEKIEKCHD